MVITKLLQTLEWESEYINALDINDVSMNEVLPISYTCNMTTRYTISYSKGRIKRTLFNISKSVIPLKYKDSISGLE